MRQGFSFILTFYLFTICATERVVELTPENPSFAVHGTRVYEMESLKISGCTKCDFLLDYSHRGCDQLPDVPIEEKTEIGTPNDLQNNKKLVPICLDELPFTINGIVYTTSNCNLMYLTPVPGSMLLLYFCSFTLKNETKLVVKANDVEAIKNYALSFRVRQWVNESQQVLVVSGSPTIRLSGYPVLESVLVRSGWIVTMVANPEIYRGTNYGPLMQLSPVPKEFDSTANCPGYQVDLTCDASVRFKFFLGPAPAPNQTETLDYDSNIIKSIPFRTSVASFYTQSDCNFCLEFQPSLDGERTLDTDSYNVLDYPSILTSYNYPWVFDDPREFSKCQDFDPYFSPNFPKSQRKVWMKVEALENGWLEAITAFGESAGLCHQKEENETFNIYAASNEPLVFPADCLTIRFCANSTEDRFGFLLMLNRSVVSREEVECSRTYILTNEEPQVILNGHDLYAWAAYDDVGVLCVRCNRTQIKDCEMLLEISSFCLIEQTKRCSNQTPLPINGAYEKPTAIQMIDQQPFVHQYLQSTLYSVLIPSGCAPSFAVNMSILQSISWNTWKQKQEICNGETIVLSHGYQDPTRFPKAPEDNGYELQHDVFCRSFTVNITVEVVSIGKGRLWLTFHGRDKKQKRVKNNTEPFMAANVSGVLVRRKEAKEKCKQKTLDTLAEKWIELSNEWTICKSFDCSKSFAKS